jgi:von Willebrand factor A domain-containing protein 8
VLQVIDRFMELTNTEREYIQLHRDTTIQSLTQIPSLVHGKIVYEDSPLITAARTGRIVVIDEVDKAPLEVVCLIKNLIEDGELVLYDGRRLVSGGGARGPNDIAVHPGFNVVCLANRPGFPFLGNNFFHECGDVFQNVLIMDNLDRQSEFELLRTYGPDVDAEVLRSIAMAFEQLREAYSGGGSGGGGGA